MKFQSSVKFSMLNPVARKLHLCDAPCFSAVWDRESFHSSAHSTVYPVHAQVVLFRRNQLGSRSWG